MKERGHLLEFEWFRVPDAKKSGLKYKVEEIAKALKGLGLFLPSKVVIGSKTEWEELFAEAASGAANRKKKIIYLPDDASPETIIHEILHVNFPDLSEREIEKITSDYDEKLDREGVLSRL